MATLRYLVSTVRAMHKLLSTDNMITDRLIAAEIKANTILLVKRETNLRRLWATDTIFTTLPCLEMKSVPVSECSSYVDDCDISRSVNKIPRISEGIYQYLIQGVYAINVMGGKSKKLKEITINRYINLLKLPIIKNEEYYWMANDYIYVSNPDVKAIRLVAMFEEDVPSDLLYSSSICGDFMPDIDELCRNPLDKNYSLPGYLQKQVLSLTSQQLLGTHFSIKPDVVQDGLDGQSPVIQKN